MPGCTAKPAWTVSGSPTVPTERDAGKNRHRAGLNRKQALLELRRTHAALLLMRHLRRDADMRSDISRDSHEPERARAAGLLRREPPRTRREPKIGDLQRKR